MSNLISKIKHKIHQYNTIVDKLTKISDQNDNFVLSQNNILNSNYYLSEILDDIRAIITDQEVFNISHDPRYSDPLRLEHYENKAYSQHGEDGIIQEIFNRIKIKHNTFVEFGVGDGLENNTLYLLKQGWNGLWIEGSGTNANLIRQNFANAIALEKLHFINTFITKDNINELIGTYFKGEIDLLSIDIDGNDYYIWDAITVVSPRVLIIEYNAKFIPPVKWSIDYNENHNWDFSDYQGASLEAMNEVSTKKGYALVACNMNGTNAFFVRNDELKDKFITSENAIDFYHPPRYYLWRGYLRMGGHKPNPLLGKHWK